ncbi:MAG TPA: hypothetical protein VGS20_09720 [Candidatus Acidoferrales bacterium]|nr:hypothetical protein [Candidatus Acidoferrales bacterium]
MERPLAVGVLTLGGLLLSATPSQAQSFSFTSIDVPCAACPGGIARRTAPGGINPAGDIVGTYTDAVGKQHGFLLSGGQFKRIDVPGSLVGSTGTLPTVARGIGPSGDIVGQFTAPYNPPASTTASEDSGAYCPAIGSVACIKGFLYSRGEFSVVLFPGHPGAIPGRITPDGSMYGCYHDFDTMASMFSAAWTRFGDTSIAAGGGALSDPNLSFPNSMHGGATPDGSIVTGFYVDMKAIPNHTHGYFLQDGVLQTYDVPDSTFTVVWDINPGKEAVGTYFDKAGKQHGFIQLPDGSVPITLDVPSTPPFNAVGNNAMGVNPAGAIVGQYADKNGHTHAFLAVPTGSQ